MFAAASSRPEACGLLCRGAAACRWVGPAVRPPRLSGVHTVLSSAGLLTPAHSACGSSAVSAPLARDPPCPPPSIRPSVTVFPKTPPSWHEPGCLSLLPPEVFQDQFALRPVARLAGRPGCPQSSPPAPDSRRIHRPPFSLLPCLSLSHARVVPGTTRVWVVAALVSNDTSLLFEIFPSLPRAAPFRVSARLGFLAAVSI